MWQFHSNVVTLKNDNRIGDLVGVVLKNEAGNKQGYSLDELLEMVQDGQTHGLKLHSYITTNQEGEEIGRGQLVFFDDDRPILMEKIEYHEDVQDVTFSEQLQSAIITSPYR